MLTIDGRHLGEKDSSLLTKLCRLLNVELTDYWISIAIADIISIRNLNRRIRDYFDGDISIDFGWTKSEDLNLVGSRNNIADLLIFDKLKIYDKNIYDPIYFIMKYIYIYHGNVIIDIGKDISSYINIDESDFYYAVATLHMDGFLSDKFCSSISSSYSVKDFFFEIERSEKWENLQYKLRESG